MEGYSEVCCCVSETLQKEELRPRERLLQLLALPVRRTPCLPVAPHWKGAMYRWPLVKYTAPLPDRDCWRLRGLGRRAASRHTAHMLPPVSKRVTFAVPEATWCCVPVPELPVPTRQRPAVSLKLSSPSPARTLQTAARAQTQTPKQPHAPSSTVKQAASGRTKHARCTPIPSPPPPPPVLHHSSPPARARAAPCHRPPQACRPPALQRLLDKSTKEEGGLGSSPSRSVRTLQLCSPSSESPSPSSSSSESPPSDGAPTSSRRSQGHKRRRPIPGYRTRRYLDNLEWYRTLRREKKLREARQLLQQLCSQDGAGIVRKGILLDTSTGGKRKRVRPQSAGPAQSRSAKAARRSWSRRLVSSSEDSMSDGSPTTEHASIHTDPAALKSPLSKSAKTRTSPTDPTADAQNTQTRKKSPSAKNATVRLPGDSPVMHKAAAGKALVTANLNGNVAQRKSTLNKDTANRSTLDIEVTVKAVECEDSPFKMSPRQQDQSGQQCPGPLGFSQTGTADSSDSAGVPSICENPRKHTISPDVEMPVPLGSSQPGSPQKQPQSGGVGQRSPELLHAVLHAMAGVVGTRQGLCQTACEGLHSGTDRQHYVASLLLHPPTPGCPQTQGVAGGTPTQEKAVVGSHYFNNLQFLLKEKAKGSLPKPQVVEEERKLQRLILELQEVTQEQEREGSQGDHDCTGFSTEFCSPCRKTESTLPPLPPGESVFTPLPPGSIFSQLPLLLHPQTPRDQQSGALEELFFSPAQQLQMAQSGLLRQLCRTVPCPPALARWLFKAMACHSDPLSSLLLCRELCALTLHAGEMHMCGVVNCGWLDNRGLMQLVVMVMRVGLDRGFRGHAHLELKHLLLVLLHNLGDWRTQLPELCMTLADLSKHHHTLLWLVQLLPDCRERWRQLRRHLSLAIMSKLLGMQKQPGPLPRHSQLAALCPLLVLMKPAVLQEQLRAQRRLAQLPPLSPDTLDLQAHYLCHSLLALAGIIVGAHNLPSRQWGDLQQLCYLLERYVLAGIREHGHFLYRSVVKDRAARLHVIWLRLLHTNVPPQLQYLNDQEQPEERSSDCKTRPDVEVL
ncbi:SLF2 protein, partial [Atractosteus spatula]|nr:SLF2 protein [Atractosteus spatula]